VLTEANQVALSPIGFMGRVRRAYPAKVAVVDPDGSSVDYGTLAAECDRMAAAVRGSGVAVGERVAVLSPNTRWLLAAHFGIPGGGAAVVALNTRLAAAEYRDILAHSKARILLLSPAMAGQLGGTDGLPVERVVMLPDGGDPGSYEEWLSGGDGEGMRPPADENALIAVNYTSGTTGRPKGVMYTHRGAYLNATSIALEFGLAADSAYLWTLPMFHCNGWSLTWGVTAVGASHVCQSSFDAAGALDLMARHPVTHLCGAPVVLAELARAGSRTGFTADRTIRAAVGGAPPTAETIAAVQAMGIEVTHLYGLTETYGPSLICEYQPDWPELAPADLARKISRQGVPTISVGDVRVGDRVNEPVPWDGVTVGEILVRSNTVAAGYLDDDEASATAFAGGWFHTGDLGVTHPDGYVEVTDRGKDVIISGGENIASIEVEKVLAAHPGVLEAAVVAMPDERWGERPVAYVTTDQDGLTERELIDFVRARIAHFKAPERVFFQALPKTSTGKIQKHLLRDQARDRAVTAEPRPGGPSATAPTA
jgi:fatty-acyl-CoA synthase